MGGSISGPLLPTPEEGKDVAEASEMQAAIALPIDEPLPPEPFPPMSLPAGPVDGCPQCASSAAAAAQPVPKPPADSPPPDTVRSTAYKFVQPKACNSEMLVKEDGSCVTRVFGPKDSSIVFLDQHLSSKRKLVLRVSATGHPLVDYSFVFGLTTCNPSTVRQHECHAVSVCSPANECGGHAITAKVRNCRIPGDLVIFEWRQRMLSVTGRANFRKYDTDRLFCGNKKAYPFLVLSGPVNGIQIVAEGETVTPAMLWPHLKSKKRIDKEREEREKGSSDAGTKVQAPKAPPAVPAPVTKCIICREAKAATACNPCGHVVFCDPCRFAAVSMRMKQCPVCRSPVSNFVRLFF